jgi:hypothetical protein
MDIALKGPHRNDYSGDEPRMSAAQHALLRQVFAGIAARDSCLVAVRWGAL